MREVGSTQRNFKLARAAFHAADEVEDPKLVTLLRTLAETVEKLTNEQIDYQRSAAHAAAKMNADWREVFKQSQEACKFGPARGHSFEALQKIKGIAALNVSFPDQDDPKERS
jgi:hypothetical protein